MAGGRDNVERIARLVSSVSRPPPVDGNGLNLGFWGVNGWMSWHLLSSARFGWGAARARTTWEALNLVFLGGEKIK